MSHPRRPPFMIRSDIHPAEAKSALQSIVDRKGKCPDMIPGCRRCPMGDWCHAPAPESTYEDIFKLADLRMDEAAKRLADMEMEDIIGQL